MGPDDGAIEDQMFPIRIIGKIGMHWVPNILITPAGKPFVDAIPMAVLCWQQPPLRSAAGDPEDAFDETATPVLLADIHFRAGPQELQYFGPLFIC